MKKNEIDQKVDEFMKDIEYSNNIVGIIDKICLSKRKNSLKYIQALFKMIQHIMKRNMFEPTHSATNAESKQYALWVLTQYINSINAIFSCLEKESHNIKVVLPLLMKLYKRERRMIFLRKRLNELGHKNILYKIFELSLRLDITPFTKHFLPSFKNYFRYSDFCHTVLKMIPSIVKDITKNKINDNDLTHRNMFVHLNCLTTFSQRMIQSCSLKQIGEPEQILYFTNDVDENIKNIKIREDTNSNNDNTDDKENSLEHSRGENDYGEGKECENLVGRGDCLGKNKIFFALYKDAFTSAWLTYMRLFQLSPKLYAGILKIMDTKLLPCMTNPLKLADFLIHSYDMGGVISILALNGLFHLIQVHGLEYNDFYPRLYKLLSRRVIDDHVIRARFFKQLDLFMTSTHLPSYLVASFIKRLAKLSVTSSPCGILTCLAMITNLMVRHPTCAYLLSNDTSTSGTDGCLEEFSHLRDPFDEKETNDLSKTGAAQSFLWEIRTLRYHYCPAVVKLAQKLVLKKLPDQEIDLLPNLEKTEYQLYMESNP